MNLPVSFPQLRNYPGATFCITGGTGSFGTTMLKFLLNNHPEVSEIRIFSRDESKQDILRKDIQSEKVRFYLGDVRDFQSTVDCIAGSDYVFHAAALKQVPSCEFFPIQAVETNILGANNVISACLSNSVKSLVCLSTDKAAYPINAMGISKAMMERLALAPFRKSRDVSTKIAITRYGNVMMSRGSVIPLFIQQINRENLVTITNPQMTRFMMSLNDSIDLVLHAFTNSSPGDLFVKKSPACTVEVLVDALGILLGKNAFERRVIGSRHGEKNYETLLTSEEKINAIESRDFFRVPIDARTLDYGIYFEEGKINNPVVLDPYTSSNAEQLTPIEVATLIGNLPEFKSLMGTHL